MEKIVTRRTTILGLISWFIPLAASFPFFDRTGQLMISQPLFKSLMVVTGGGLGAALLVLAFRQIRVSWQAEQLPAKPPCRIAHATQGQRSAAGPTRARCEEDCPEPRMRSPSIFLTLTA